MKYIEQTGGGMGVSTAKSGEDLKDATLIKHM